MTTPTTPVPAPHHYADLALADLDVSPKNVRKRDITADLDELAQSLATIGQQQPIVVQETGVPGRYEILIGQRRYLAAKQLGWSRIEAKVLDAPLDDFQAKVFSFSENVQRRDLSPRDKGEVCARMLETLGSPAAVATRLGVSQATVRKWLGYNAVPDAIKELVAENKLTRGQASRIWAGSRDNDESAIRVAQLVAEQPYLPAERDRILTAFEEAPDRPLERILSRAEELKDVIEVRFIMPERWSSAIKEAADELQKEPSDIAREATVEWLQAHQYFAG